MRHGGAIGCRGQGLAHLAAEVRRDTVEQRLTEGGVDGAVDEDDAVLAADSEGWDHDQISISISSASTRLNCIHCSSVKYCRSSTVPSSCTSCGGGTGIMSSMRTQR